MENKIIFPDDNSGDAFTDLLFNALLGFAFMFFISFALIQKPVDEGNIESKAEFIISVEWEDYHPDDVDLIVEDPLGNIVYFQNKEDGLMHLDRDDRGTLADRLIIDGVNVENPANQEIITIRGIMAGEYIVNLLHYKANFVVPLKTKVKVEKINPRVEIVYFGNHFLTKTGDELTAVRFFLDEKGNVQDLNFIEKLLITKNGILKQ
ncbi:MAG: hypothetical protein VYC43_01755 [Pseudomonadota bacterium]|nr:hypothetical protein [Pseudomonadota bacterium]MEC9414280.1 hypothetical protein [Pseudomonadota bacterium]MEC9481411.1 hypothetical protein [Pseudomonadota bacterium]